MGAHLTSTDFLRNSKYVVFELQGLEVPVVFSPLITHKDVRVGDAKVVSAGFCDIDENGNYFVWGESVSLEKKCRPQDVDLLNALLSLDQ